MRSTLVRALAFAHAALDRPTAARLERARMRGRAAIDAVNARVLCTLAEARNILALAAQLRAVLGAIEHAQSSGGGARGSGPAARRRSA
jgi:hypothetical protein